MRKRVLAMFLALAMVFSMLPVSAFAEEPEAEAAETAAVELTAETTGELIPEPEPAEEPEPEPEPETIPETEPETIPVTVPETEPETVPETEPEMIQETDPMPSESSDVEIADSDGIVDLFTGTYVSPEYGEGVSFDFTVPETGVYFASFAGGSEYEVNFWLDGRLLCSGNMIEAEKDVVYTIGVRNWDPLNGTDFLRLIESVPPRRISIEPETVIGCELEVLYPKVSLYPKNADPTHLVWTSMDESVVRVINVTNEYATIQLENPGETTIEITAEGSDATFSLPVIVPSLIGTIQPDEVLHVNVLSNSEARLTFTPTETGDYTFWEVNEATQNLEVIGADYELAGTCGVSFHAEAGTDYQLRLWSETTETFAVCVSKTVQTREVSLEPVSGNRGEYKDLTLRYDPLYAVHDRFTWTVEDPSIAEIVSNNPDADGIEAGGCTLLLKEPGETVVTATSSTGSGLEASCKITVYGNPDLPLDESQTVTLSLGESVYYQFIAPETANYSIVFDEGVNMRSFVSLNGKEIVGEDTFYAVQGTEYLIQVENVWFDGLAKSTFHLTKLEPLTSLQLNVWYEIPISSAEDLVYEFTAPETGRYTFDFEGLVLATYVDGERVLSGRTFDAVAGEVYTITIHSWYDESYTTTFCLEKAIPPTSIQLSYPDSVQGVPGQSIYAELRIYPENADTTNLIWTSQDETVAKVVESWGSGRQIELVGAGQTTIEVTYDGTDLRCSIPVTVNEVNDTIALEETKTVTLSYSDQVAYLFTPEKAGWYTFWEGNSFQGSMEVHNGDNWSSGWGMVKFQCEAGVTYTLVYEGYQSPARECRLTVSKSTEAEKVSMEPVSGYAGDNVNLEVLYEPAYADRRWFSWSISDPSIAQIRWSDSDGCGLDLKQAGEVTVTARTDDGLEVSCVVKVMAPPELQLDEIQTLTLDYDQSAFYTFTAPETASYSLVFSGKNNPSITISQDGESISYESTFNAVEGGVYTIHLQSWYENSIDASFRLIKSPAVQNITLDREPSWDGFVGQKIQYRVSVSPDGADTSELIWQNDNETVARATDYYNGNTACQIELLSPGTAHFTVSAPSSGASVSFTVNVSAVTNSIQLDTPVTVRLQPGEKAAYGFTSSDFSSYVFWDSTGTAYLQASSAYYYNGARGSCYIGSASPDEEYILVCQNTQSEEAEYTLNISKTVPPESISLSESTLTGVVGQQCWLNVLYEPVNSERVETRWSTSDPSVATVDYGGVYLNGVGTAVITATTASGLTATCQVTVTEPETLSLGSFPVTLNPNESVIYAFTAPKDGGYTLWDPDFGGYTIEVREAQSGGWMTGGDIGNFYAYEGMTYLLTIRNESSTKQTFSFRFEENVPIEFIDLHCEQSQVRVGAVFEMYVGWSPVNANSEMCTFTVDDPSCARIIASDDYGYVQLEALKEGQVTVTAKTESGLTRSCTVTISNSASDDSIGVGGYRNLTLSPNSSTDLSFTAPSDGTYTLWCEDNLPIWPHIEVFDEDGTSISLSWLRNSFRAQGGKTYRIYVLNYFEGTLNFDLHMNEAVSAWDMWPDYNETTIPVGTVTGVTLKMNPVYADRSQVQWYSDDPSVVEIVEGKQNDCQFKGLKAGEAVIIAEDGYGHSTLVIVHVVDATELTEGREVTVDTQFGEEKIFTFTPAEDGNYIIRYTRGNDAWMHLYGSNVDMWNHDWVQAYLNGGETYTITARTWNDQISQVSYIAEKTVPATGVTFQQAQYSGFVGQVIDAKLNYQPANGQMEDMEYTISGTGGAELVDPWKVGTRLRLTKPGTFTLTATSRESGLTASCTVTVMDTAVWNLDETKSLTMTPNDNNDPCCAFQFTAPEDGDYVIHWNEEEIRGFDPAVNVFRSNGEEIAGGNASCYFHADKDESYLITIRSCSDRGYDANFTLNRTTDQGGIYFWDGELAGFVGDRIWNRVSSNPGNYDHGDITWSSSNTNVVRISNPQWSACEYELVGPGDAVLTATDSNGKSASFTVHVVQPEMWNLGDTKNLYLEPSYGETPAYVAQFVAPADGTYLIWQENDTYTWIDVLDSDGTWLGEHSDGWVQFEARKGETYTIRVWMNYDRPADTILHLEIPVTCQGIKPLWDGQANLTLFSGDSLSWWLSLDYTPRNALRSSITWTSSNANVVEINHEHSGAGGCEIQAKQPGTAVITAVCADDPTIKTSFTITVKEAGAWSFGDTKTLDMHPSDGGGAEYGFRFTAPDDNGYIVWQEDHEWCWIEVFDSNGELVGLNGGGFCQFDAKKGETYSILIGSNYYEPTRDVFHLDTLTPVTAIEPRYPEQANMTSFVGNSDWLGLAFTPGNASRGQIEWESSNPDCVEILQTSEDSCQVLMKQPGTATITATHQRVAGVSTSFTITVQPVGELKAGTTTVTMKGQDSMSAYDFTAPEDATYVIYDETEQYGSIEVRFWTDDGYEENYWGDNRVQFTARKGQTYRVIFHHWDEAEKTYSYVLTKAVPLTGMEFPEDSWQGFVGTTYWLNVKAHPANADLSGIIWSVSDESVAVLGDGTDANRGVRLIGAGTVTVTATVGDLKATCVFTVEEPDTIRVGDVKKVTLPAEGMAGYVFTPAESGTYVFWDEAQVLSRYEVFNDRGDYVAGFTGNRVAFYAEAGQSYIISVCNYRGNSQFEFHLEAETAAKELIIQYGETIYEYVGMDFDLNVNVSPGNGIPGKLEWTSSNPDVLEVLEYDPYDLWCVFRSKSVGQTTLTVRDLENGLESSIQVFIRANKPITLGKTMQVSQQSRYDYARMTFTPEKTGTYVLKVDTDATVGTWISTSQEDLLTWDSLNSTNNVLEGELQAGVTYIVETMLFDADGNAITGTYSLTVTLSGDQAPLAIVSQPENYVGTLNSDASFTVGVNREDVTYQWYYSNDGTNWTKSSAAGSNTDTLTVRLTAVRLGQQYRCVITDSEGNTVTTNAVTMLLPPSTIEIQSQPVDYYGAVADQAAFTVEATGEGLTYRWYYSGTGGATWAASYSDGYQTATLKPVLRAYNSGRMFKCQITDANGNTEWTQAVTMALASSGITIVTQPVSYTGAINDLATFTVEAEGTNLTYQWYFSKDGGENWEMSFNDGYYTPSMKVRLYAYRSGYQYKCVITSGGSVSVETDVVTIAKKAATVAITQQPLNAGGPEGTNVTFHVGATGNGLTYQWQFSKDGGATWGNTSMTGAKTETLTVGVVAYRDGWQYRCVVTDDSGTSVTTNPAVLRVGNAPVITGQPESYNGPAGGTANFTVTVSGEDLSYQWQYSNDGGTKWVNSGTAGANTPSIAVAALAHRNGQQYRCVVTNAYGSVVSEAAVLTIK